MNALGLKVSLSPDVCMQGLMQGPSTGRCSRWSSAAANSALPVRPRRTTHADAVVSDSTITASNRHLPRQQQMAGWRSLSVVLALFLAFCGAAQAHRRKALQEETLVGTTASGGHWRRRLLTAAAASECVQRPFCRACRTHAPCRQLPKRCLMLPPFCKSSTVGSLACSPCWPS